MARNALPLMATLIAIGLTVFGHLFFQMPWYGCVMVPLMCAFLYCYALGEPNR